MLRYIPIVVILLILFLGVGYYFGYDIGYERAYKNRIQNPDIPPAPTTDITSFQDCVAAGNPVMESYPRQCRSASGENFVEDIGNSLAKNDLVRIFYPRPNELITTPITIVGEARGYWFFEATFPVMLTNWDGLIISSHYATANGEWMTEEFVPFTAEITFEKPVYKNNGSLILHKSNASGLPEHDDALEIPILFE